MAKKNWQILLIGLSAGFMLILLGMGVFSIFTSKAQTISLLKSKENKINEKILGRWEGKVEGANIALIFTGERVIILEKDDQSAKELGEYKIDHNSNPMRLDIGFKENLLLAIIEFLGDDKLRIQHSFEKTRPATFDENAIVLKKVSNATVLPINVKFETIEQQIAKGELNSKQAEAKLTLQAMKRAQQSFYLDNKTFTNNQSKLNVYFQENDYKFNIQLITKNQIKMSAIPKINGAKSYIAGITYAPNSRSYNTVMCASNAPSRDAPSLQIRGGSFQCSGDSYELR